MKKLDLVREPVSALGGMGGRGARNVLGAPKVSVLETVVREAVQNSWDARVGSDPVRFRVDAFSFSRSQRAAIADALADGLKQKPPVLQLPDAGDQFDAIVISDRGTTGLGGRPTAEAADGNDGDFARFVFSIGETKVRPGQVSAGGTYGFGRSAFLEASAAGTILVHTVCSVPGKKGTCESRFIGMHWGKGYRLDRTQERFTGRHWWGRGNGSGVLPVTGPDADALARAVGMPAPENGATGTSILILDPKWMMADGTDSEDEFDLDSAREHARRRISQALLWYVWPRIHDGDLEVAMKWFGKDVGLPAPASHARLKLFVKARELAEKEREARRFEHSAAIECGKPRKDLGHLGLAKRIHVVQHDDDYLPDSSGPLRHVALMRDTRLVVQYLPCTPGADRWEYAGVFVTDPGVDRIFADSEPPTHDDWSKEKLRERNHRVFVNVALREVSAQARGFAMPGSIAPDGSASGLGPISDALGSLLADITGSSTKVIRPPPKKTGGRGEAGGGGGGRKIPSGPRIELGAPERDEEGGREVLKVPFTIDGCQQPSSVTAKAAVIIEGGATEAEAPEGSAVPEVIGWELNGASNRKRGAILKVPADETLQGVLVVSQPADCTVRVAVDPVR